ncbi:uncharacterized protein LOC143037685 [Oratosquilla oratoria]|uniref:uncharacterized protein LOC143037685 n=1 Tax=Oratosquilla oratoria TaxID=337810 RepID=UPI003F768DA7
MKIFLIAAVLCFASVVRAEDVEKMEEEGRFGFLTLDNNGATLTFNSTSIQYAVLIGLAVLLGSLILLPLFGLSLGSIFNSGYEAPVYGYDTSGYASSYSSYAKRSLDFLSPVLTALKDAYAKYEN